MGSLAEKGWRYVLDEERGWVWKNPADVLDTDQDATDATDEEFEAMVGFASLA